MNFSTHALQYIEKVIAQMQLQPSMFFDVQALRTLMDSLHNSIKFLLPINGNVGIEVFDQKTFDLVRMPYPKIVFEFPCEATAIEGRLASTKRIALATETTVNDKLGIDIICIFELGKEWITSPVRAFVSYDSEVILHNGTTQISASSGVLLPGCLREAMRQNNLSINDLTTHFASDMQEEVFAVVRALACLNAKNVQAVSIPPSATLNKKRIRNGKSPLFEYYTLNIFLGDAAILARPKDRNRIASTLLRQQARLHTVRGHFKRKKNGIFWWSSFIRGSAKAGEIKKDYKLE